MFVLDTVTLIVVLFWCNLASALLVYVYQKTDRCVSKKPQIQHLAGVKLFTAAGYLLLFFRGTLPDWASVNLGNSILFACFWVEACLLLSVTGSITKKTVAAQSAILVLSVLVFNVAEALWHAPFLRITLASIIIFASLCIATIKLLVSKGVSRFKHIIGGFYGFLLLALVLRTVFSLLQRDVALHSNTPYQTIFFLALIMISVTSLLIHLLFMKEESDALIEAMANTDNLTQLANRHCFIRHGKMLFDRAREERKEITLLFFDIDHFKSINDRYGHAFGDIVLTKFAATIRSNIRTCDLCCRYGGEEFVIVILGFGPEFGVRVGNRIMAAIQEIEFDEHQNFHFTTSVGVFSSVPEEGEALEDYIKCSDQALYRAKNSGRNRLILYGEEG